MKESIKKKFDSIDQSKIKVESTKEFLGKLEKGLNSKTQENADKAEALLDKFIAQAKAKNADIFVSNKPAPTLTPTAKKKANQVVKSKLDSLMDTIANDPLLKDFNNSRRTKGGGKSDPLIDSERKAIQSGPRVSKQGWKNQYGKSTGGRKYYEYRENRIDRKAPNYGSRPWLEEGGFIHPSDANADKYVVVEIKADGSRREHNNFGDLETARMFASLKREFLPKGSQLMIEDKNGKNLYRSFKSGGYMADGGELTEKDYEMAFAPRYLDGQDFAKISDNINKEYLAKDRKSGVHDKFTKYWYSGGREQAMAKYGDDENQAWEEAYEDFKDDYYKMAKGGKIDESTAMVLSQNKAIAHHTEELKKAISKNEKVEPWVIGKMQRATTDMSDVTHYFDGMTEYAKGGRLKEFKVGDKVIYALNGKWFTRNKQNFKSGEITKVEVINGVKVYTIEFKNRFGTLIDTQKTTNTKEIEIDQDEEMANGGMMADGGKVRWQDVYVGDNALVIAENKMGMVVKPYGRRFHLKFPDGSERTYSAEELEFFKDDEFAKGGELGHKIKKGEIKIGDKIYKAWFKDESTDSSFRKVFIKADSEAEATRKAKVLDDKNFVYVNGYIKVYGNFEINDLKDDGAKIFAKGGQVGDFFYDSRKDKTFQVIFEDGDKMGLQYLGMDKKPVGGVTTITKNEFEYNVEKGSWGKWKQEFAKGGNISGYKLKDIKGRLIEEGDMVKTKQAEGGLMSASEGQVGIVEKTKDAFNNDALLIRFKKTGKNYDTTILLNGQINEIVEKGKNSKSATSTTGKYVNKRNVLNLVVKNPNKNGIKKYLSINPKDFLDGLHEYAQGGKLTDDYTYIKRSEVWHVIYRDSKNNEQLDFKPKNGFWVRKKALVDAGMNETKAKFDKNEVANELIALSNKAWDTLSIQSGSEIYASDSLQENLANGYQKLGVDRIYRQLTLPERKKVSAVLTDENEHSLRNYLALRGYNGEAEFKNYAKMYDESFAKFGYRSNWNPKNVDLKLGSFAKGGQVGDFFYDSRKDKAFQVIFEDGDKMGLQYLGMDKKPVGGVTTITKNEFEYNVEKGSWGKWKQEFAKGGMMADGGEIEKRVSKLLIELKLASKNKEEEKFDNISNQIHEILDGEGLSEKEYEMWHNLRNDENERRMDEYFKKMANGGMMAKGGSISDGGKLPEDMGRYFIKTSKTKVVNMSDLIPLRKRATGIANAEKNMKMAYDGEMDKRKPITIYKSQRKYRILDGNSTYAVAKANGWETIWAEIVKNPNMKNGLKRTDDIFSRAKSIRKEGESWQDALQRAKAMK